MQNCLRLLARWLSRKSPTGLGVLDRLEVGHVRIESRLAHFEGQIDPLKRMVENMRTDDDLRLDANNTTNPSSID